MGDVMKQRSGRALAALWVWMASAALSPGGAHANPAGAGGASAGISADAAAPLEPPSGPFLVSNQAIPGNGALLLNDYGGHGYSLVVTSPAGEDVPGSYVQVWDFYWAFRPSAPLLPGTYLIESTNGPPLHQRNGVLSSSFTVGPEVDLSQPVLTAEPSVSLVTESLSPLCCDLWTDFAVQIGACAPTGQQSRAGLEPGLSSSTGSVALSQYLFALWPTEQASSGYAPWSTPRGLSFATAADEYCFEVETIAIFDSTVHRYEDLEPRCVPHGDLGELGEDQLDPPPSFYDRTRCTEPPDGFDDQWCEANADCEDNSDVDCVMFDHLCNGGERPSWQPPGTGGFGGGFMTGGAGGAAGMEVSGGAGGKGGASGEGGESGAAGMSESGGTGGDDDDEPAAKGEGGCSVRVADVDARPSAAWLALGTALALVALRRRKPR